MPRDATNTPASHTSALGELFIADEWAGAQAKVYEVGSEAEFFFRPSGALALCPSPFPTACAVGCILPPLCGWPSTAFCFAFGIMVPANTKENQAALDGQPGAAVPT